MKRLFKYLIFLIFAVALCNDVSQSGSSIDEEPFSLCNTDAALFSANLSVSDCDIYFSRQFSSTSSARLQSNVRRAGNGLRNIIEYVKSGKTENSGIRYSVYRNHRYLYSSLIEPSHRLMRLCKLII